MPDKVENDKVEEILSKIFELNSSEKSRFLRKLVKKTATKNSSEMNFLRSLVLAVPVGSNLDKLPGEVFSQVLSYLDARTLGRLALTSKKSSETILSDNRPWKNIFDKENEAGRISEVTKMFQNQITHSIQHSRTTTSPYSSSLPYTAAFFYESRLQQNWSKANPGKRPIGFDCHGSHVITCMEIDPKGQFILTGSDDGTVRLWNIHTNKEPLELCVYSGHLGGVWALKVDWERGILVTGSTDRTLIIWDLAQGTRLKHLLGHTSTVRCVELYGDLVISGSRDGTLRVWNVYSGECLHVLQGHTASVRCLSLGPEAGTIVSGSYDNTCRLWKLNNGQCLRVFEGHSNKVYAVSSSDDKIFSGSLDGTVRVWNAASGECLKKFEGHRSLVGLVQSDDKLMPNTVITGSTDGSLQVIKRRSSNDNSDSEVFETSLIPGAHPSSITSLDFNRNFLVTGSEGAVRLWSLESGRAEPRHLARLIEHIDMVWRVAVTDNLAVVAYQIQGQTRLAIFNFAPQPQQILIEMRAFRQSTINNNSNNSFNINEYSKMIDAELEHQQQSYHQSYHHQSYHQLNQHTYHNQFFMSTETENNLSLICNNHEIPSTHPELLVLGLASQSIAEDELI